MPGVDGEPAALLQTGSATPVYTNGGDSEAGCAVISALTLDHLSWLRRSADTMLVVALLSLSYLGVNLTLCVVNAASEEFRDSVEVGFHMCEFWATAVYALVEAIALVKGPRPLAQVHSSTTALATILFFNVAASIVPALLITFSLDKYEVPAHELEYMNEITMSFVDLVLLVSLLKSRKQWLPQIAQSSAGLTLIALVVAIIQLSVYNGMRGYDGGPGEQYAHFIEFVFEVLSAGVTSWFALDSYMYAMREVAKIEQGEHSA